MTRWLQRLATAVVLLAPAMAAAQAPNLVACRFEAGPRFRLALEPQLVAIQLPEQTLWQEAGEVISLRDPLLAGFFHPAPETAGRRLPAHERFTLSINRVTGEARMTLQRRPPADEQARCRAVAEAARPADGEAAGEDATRDPPAPCDLPQPVTVLAGVCEAVRVKF